MEEALENTKRKDASCQTELSSIDITNMENDLKRSTEEINKLEREVLSASLTKESFENNDEKVLFYTGLPNFITPMAIFYLLESFITLTARCSLDKFQQVLVFLMRMRLNSACEDLGYRFVVSRSTISRTFLNILDIAAFRLACVCPRSFFVQQNPFSFNPSSISVSLIQNWTSDFHTPSPQQSHFAIPLGDTPINGWSVEMTNPDSFNIKFVCFLDIMSS